MKQTLRKLFSPLLDRLEAGDGAYAYRPSHRTILMAVGALFFLLSFGAVVASVLSGGLGGVFPAVVFFTLGLVSVVVAFLGSDRAVARLWGGR
jgi:uncharacterized membrane protein